MNNKKGRIQAATINSTSNYNSPEHEFAEAIMRDVGALIAPEADGQIHRFNDPDGRLNNRACWYVLHLNPDGFAAGVYGRWRTSERFYWNNSATMSRLYPNKRSAYKKRVLDACNRRSRLQVVQHIQAAAEAKKRWEQALPASVQHPYLRAKCAPALGLRESNGYLLVPLKNVDGQLMSLQYINAQGQKRFLKDGRTRACFFLVGAKALPSDGVVYVCEGVATGLTVWNELKLPVACAMNCGNLAPVCKAIRSRYKKVKIVVAADNDHKTKGNPGISKAREAAQFSGAAITWPVPCGEQCSCTDFNDFANCGFTGGVQWGK